MMAWIQSAAWSIYWLSTFITGVYCVYHFILSVIRLFRTPSFKSSEPLEVMPDVTIQLPIFNESAVAYALFESVDKIQYPNHLLEIQILDDSTDNTLKISQEWYQKWTQEGKNVKLFNRKVRTGYKAGALQAALEKTDGKYIAIFDADFRPDPNFINELLPFLQKDEVAAVQARWSFQNQDDNLITQLQAMQLNAHFYTEQKVKNDLHWPLQFNGTGGIWKKSAIEEAGGWQADTLTEDLDLSYRVQMQGKRIVYYPDKNILCELPYEMSGLKIQQHRWMKGGAETARKLLPKLWTSGLSPSQKIMGSIHLLSSTVYIAVFTMVVSSLLITITLNQQSLPSSTSYLGYTPFFLFAFGLWVANPPDARKNDVMLQRLALLIKIPLLLIFSLGLSFHNGRAALEGWRGVKSPFNRTPKVGQQKKLKLLHSPASILEQLPEIILASFCFLALCIKGKDYSFFYFHILASIGYLSIFFLTIKSQFK